MNVRGEASCQEGCEQKQCRLHNLDEAFSASRTIKKIKNKKIKSVYTVQCSCKGKNPCTGAGCPEELW